MRVLPMIAASAIALAGMAGTGCEGVMPGSLLNTDGVTVPAPDGIDPNNPNIERSTQTIDFSNIATLRIELPTGRVSITQSATAENATLQVTEIIVKEGLGHDLLEEHLTQSIVTAERSFVDPERLDIEATVAEDLADTDIVFDLRLVVPRGANVEILVGNGPVEINELTGNVEIHTDNGAIDVNGVDGSVVAETTHRSVTVMDATGNVKALTTDADVTMRLTPPGEGQISAETTTGRIRLTVAQETAARLLLTTVEGVVAADLKGFNVRDVATGEGFLEGILNGGGGRIEARSTSGRIEFSGMPAGN